MRWHWPVLERWHESAGDKFALQTGCAPPTDCLSRSGCRSFFFATKPRSEGHVPLRCWWAQHPVHPRISKASPVLPIPVGRVYRHHHRLLQKAAGATPDENKNRSTVFDSEVRGQNGINVSAQQPIAHRSVGRIHPTLGQCLGPAD